MKSISIKDIAINTLYFLASMTILLGIWHLISVITKAEIPSPASTWVVFKELIADPFYDYGPNDKGIGIQLLSSLGRVSTGFALGSLIAIPMGLLMGSTKIGMKLLNPIVQILRPVSPLAWFPLGLLAFKASDGATIFIIAITSLWPTVINTAFGVSSIPDDHKNVGKAFGFSKWKYLTKIMLPFAIPHIITGLRLSIGIAWVVIVAGEMLSGGVGIGFFVWDSWNGLSLEKILVAILIIGTVGLLFDKAFNGLQNAFSWDKK
ncbi:MULTISPECIES: nitrate ABC transporter permease [unclassified Arcicella]|uniref:nitrate ABC transporter permease n=1 Tax=unclassified Arcicella TaxID=2644986 RepID=UPI002866CFDF|nr:MULTISPECIES: nitrate ABC transporter permease [unclassified Arcicella]MDR6564497.1 nitrate/nitrite transport system permease protein [Arcicella sp. BE51]MDR6814356.1 nitrate/nitrite transport system permease protein [Arcicella sp. BE140]MDR6825622.1 nitrate/nitrite transport system permease protein [Arcicella sp. BE139]